MSEPIKLKDLKVGDEFPVDTVVGPFWLPLFGDGGYEMIGPFYAPIGVIA